MTLFYSYLSLGRGAAEDDRGADEDRAGEAAAEEEGGEEDEGGAEGHPGEGERPAEALVLLRGRRRVGGGQQCVMMVHNLWAPLSQMTWRQKKKARLPDFPAFCSFFF